MEIFQKAIGLILEIFVESITKIYLFLRILHNNNKIFEFQVDLSLSDSDDDLPLKRRQPATQANKNGNKVLAASTKSGMNNNFLYN